MRLNHFPLPTTDRYGHAIKALTTFGTSGQALPIKRNEASSANQDRAAHRAHPIRLVLVEDDVRLLIMLRDALAACPGFEVLSSHHSAEQALANADWGHCTILLTDLTLPGLSGVELIRHAKTIRPKLIAAAYTVNNRRDQVLSAIRAGASGYILKRDSLAEISSAIRELAAGGAPISPSIACMILDELRDSESTASDPQLSHREREVLGLVGDGYAQKEIADFLSISLNTVQTHTKRIYKKLQANGREDALDKARRSGQL